MPELQQLTARKVALFGIVLGLLVFSFWILFPAKLECSADGPTHAFGAWFYQYALKSYQSVPWTNPHQYSGSMFASIYFSIFYVLSGLVSLAVASYTIAIKLVIVALYALSAFFMYLLAKEYGLSREKSLLVGALYALSNWQIFSTFFRGAYLDVAAYALFPLPFLFMKRGLDRNIVPFMASLVLLLMSNQVSMLFFLPAVFIYGAVMAKRISLRQFLLSVLVLAISTAFFFVPFMQLQGETYFFQDLSLKIAPTIPLNLFLPQWGLRYDLYDQFFMKWGSLDSIYLGLMRVILAAAGIAVFWRKFPELSVLAALSIGFLSGIIPSSTFPARSLIILAIPLSLFAAMGLDSILKNKRLFVFSTAVAAFLNSAGILVMLKVYALRSGLGGGLLPIAVVALAAFWILVFVLRKYGRMSAVGLVLLLLAFEVLPGAANPTMVLPTKQQINQCGYAGGAHEAVANAFCAPQDCDNAYVYQQGHYQLGSRPLMGQFLKESPGCKDGLSELGIRYCFDGQAMRQFEPAPFLNSTSSYKIVRDEPDNVVVEFDRPGNSTMALGYFKEYKIIGGDGKDVAYGPDPATGFLSFSNPAGTLSVRFLPPKAFLYSYLASFVAILSLLAFLLTGSSGKKPEVLMLVAGLAVLLFHIGIRLAVMFV